MKHVLQLSQPGPADAEIKVLCAENPKLSEILHARPAVDLNLVLHVLPTERSSASPISAFLLIPFFVLFSRSSSQKVMYVMKSESEFACASINCVFALI